MSTRPIIPPPAVQSPEEFRPENFKKKSNVRDYVIYASVLIVVLGVIGGAVYYFTRSEDEKEKLRARFRDDRPPMDVAELKTSIAETLLAQKDPEPVAPVKVEPKPVAVSTYSGGGPNRVVPSTDPKLPQPGLGFIQFVEGLKVSSVVQGPPPKLMIAGKMYRVGEIIDESQAVTFLGVDGVKNFILLRDKSGAELGLSF